MMQLVELDDWVRKEKVKEAIRKIKSKVTFTNRNWDIVLKQELGL